jgi:hypothetical protein
MREQLVSHMKKKTQAKGVGEQTVEEDIMA